jgi:hypothetical protein
MPTNFSSITLQCHRAYKIQNLLRFCQSSNSRGLQQRTPRGGGGTSICCCKPPPPTPFVPLSCRAVPYARCGCGAPRPDVLQCAGRQMLQLGGVHVFMCWGLDLFAGLRPSSAELSRIRVVYCNGRSQWLRNGCWLTQSVPFHCDYAQICRVSFDTANAGLLPQRHNAIARGRATRRSQLAPALARSVLPHRSCWTRTSVRECPTST